MKIGILTLVNQLNYGGVLQAYALQKVLSERGYDSEVINYWLSPNNEYLKGAIFRNARFFWKGAFWFFYGVFCNRSVLSNEIRCYKTRRFIRNSIKLSKMVYKRREDLNLIKEYDCIVVGSDQVWNYSWHGTPNVFLLKDVDQSIKRVSYAASMGFKILPSEYLPDYQDGLNRFSQISVRENEGVQQIKDWIGKTVAVCLDPVLLLPRDGWKQIVKSQPKQEYLFCYWLGDIGCDLCFQLERLIKLYRVKVYFITNKHPNDTKPIEQIRGVIIRRSVGPSEFVDMIANASYILSDSFHAMMFGCIFEKKMIIIGESSEGRAKMTARLYDFCCKYSLSEIYSENLSNSELSFQPVDYSSFSAILEHDRQVSLTYLDGLSAL